MRFKMPLFSFWLLATLLNQQAMLQTCSADGKLGRFIGHLLLAWAALTLISLLALFSSSKVGLGLLSFGGYALALVSGFVFSHARPICLQSTLWYVFFWLLLWHVGLLLVYPSLGARLALILFSLIFTGLLLEGEIRAYFRLDAIENTAIMKPHPQLGWTWIPNHTFIWRERNPACSSFRIDVSTNSWGFVDDEPRIEKSPQIIRIAVLGDSFVEAIQVPLEKRATNILAEKLGKEYEVQNWGMSAYSVGQMWLSYQHVVKNFQPDYVLILLSELVLNRTPETGVALSQNANTRLSLRPVFRWESNSQSIYALPAYDFSVAESRYWADLVDKNEKPKLPPIYLAPTHSSTWSEWRSTPYEALKQESQWLNFLSYRLKGFWGIFASQNFELPRDTNPRSNYYVGADSHRALLLANYSLLEQWAEETQKDGVKNALGR